MFEDRFQQIPRRADLSQAQFEQEFLLQGKPVILTNLFNNQPIQTLVNIESVRRQFGGIPLIVSEGIRDYHLAQTNFYSQSARSLMLNEYLDLIDREPETALLCSENALPDPIQTLFTMPDHCQFGDANDRTTRLFLGNAGNYAHLHFDGDFRQVLFYQVCGSKRIVIIPANAASKLAPFQHWSLVCLEHMSEAEKDAFITYAGGVQCILNPGEALFFPAAVWHYVEYLTTGMSIAIRFGRNRYTQFLSEKCHLDSKLQCIASHMIDERIVQVKYSKEYEIIEQALYRPAKNIQEKIRQMSIAYDRVWNAIAESTEPLYQLSIPDRLAQISLRMQAQQRYANYIHPIPSFSGWGWNTTTRSEPKLSK